MSTDDGEQSEDRFAGECDITIENITGYVPPRGDEFDSGAGDLDALLDSTLPSVHVEIRTVTSEKSHGDVGTEYLHFTVKGSRNSKFKVNFDLILSP